ncbi:uncharacterized protein CTRU02_212701 [Colletotrichum truncatum]|uniref:Uncharacterized protein n=1 Tax=Colletotrichum truncatum TaxID=5467 RepID=A0ACC3YIL8_COLTU|nr:uncharacterized protein CTRU02_05226 [Colletotrichum truncatum]KAF6794394.1 hypothetical protein CTRU02_05226 [Colletotrichum truncatum]
MPPIQIHSASPINASKASGPTPQTEPAQAQGIPANAAGLSQNPVGANASSATHQQPYPPAQPGAAPSLPVQTTSAQAYPVPRPTPTTATDDVSQPPPPQPGAAPVPSAGKSTLPPPPKAGETYQPPAPTPATQATVPYPPQMTIPPPTMSYAAQRGSSTSTNTAYGPQMTGPQPIPLGGDPASSLEHPPGYQQDVSASEFNSHQRAAHNAAVASAVERGPQAQTDEGVWDTAKKWAAAAGGSLVAAEQEVWRRINKD